MEKALIMLVVLCMICSQICAPCFAFEALSKGSKGDLVVEIQNRLNELGYSVGKADGDFGGKTEKAIKAFQKENDLEQTGIVDDATFIVLFDKESTDSQEKSVPDESDSSTDGIAPQNAIYKNDIVDIWKWHGNGVRILTTDGDLWELLAWESGETKLELKYSGIKSVLGIDHNVLIFDDGSIITESIDYDLGDEWLDVVIAGISSNHAVGLKADGTWVSAGQYANGERDVDNWSDIISVEAGFDHTIGLKSDGTVVATGKNNEGAVQCF